MDTQRHEGQVLSSIKRTCDRLDLGKTTIFKLINEGKLDTVKVGAKTLITEASIRRFAQPPAVAA